MRIIDLEQNTPEWEDFRRYHLGASDIAILMNGTASEIQQLYLAKTVGAKKFVTSAMQRGKDMEFLARDWFNSKGHYFMPVVGVHDTIPWLMASFDGMDPPNILEIKCPVNMPDSVEQHDNYSRWWWQVQAQLCVSGFEKGFLLAYSPLMQVWSTVDRDEGAIARLIEAGEVFMERVRNYDPPEEEIDNREDYVAQEAIADWVEKKSALHIAEEEEKLARERIIDISNDHPFSCNGITVRKVSKVGVIDYKSIPELEGVDLEAYRKKGSSHWRIS